eukprot:8164325-Alexandrium_andersonii.AAC.1
MSASLVGSEMCIRDRQCWQRSKSSPPRPPLWEGCRPPRTLPKTASGAVSYTHLTLPTICSV